MPDAPARGAGLCLALRHVSAPQTGQGLHSLVTPLLTLSFPSKLKPFYSTEENSELMDVCIHSFISLQPPGEDNESRKVGPSGPPHFLGQDLEVDINMGSAKSPPS